MIAIADYGVGNIFSLQSSFKFIGADAYLTKDPDKLKEADKIILPGVGAFEDAAQKLKKSGLRDSILEETAKGKPLLGICLGMQMLFERSFEYGEHKGLGLIGGDICPIAPDVTAGLKIPHIGWNSLHFPEGKEKSKIYKYVNDGDCVYFVHSYYGKNCDEYISATTEYGGTLTASVENGNVYGTQFHPEKSGKVGLSIIKAFCELE
ncbi:MAG: imidazole glycerol phosphate synthase subunit HisH [Clostridia bacterium]|nr:imidazole glycerol phosphate synthase subunit HisH [Clostridia bacterium]